MGSLGTDGFHELDQTPCFSQHILSPLRWGSPPGPVCSGGHRLPRPRAATGMSACCSCHHLPLQPVHLPLPAFPTAKSYQATACPSACDWKPQRALERECWKHARGGVWERRDLGSSHISMWVDTVWLTDHLTFELSPWESSPLLSFYLRLHASFLLVLTFRQKRAFICPDAKSRGFCSLCVTSCHSCRPVTLPTSQLDFKVFLFGLLRFKYAEVFDAWNLLWIEGRRESHQGPSRAPRPFGTQQFCFRHHRTRKWTHDIVLWLKDPGNQARQTFPFSLRKRNNSAFRNRNLTNINEAFAEGLTKTPEVLIEPVGRSPIERGVTFLSQACFFSICPLEGRLFYLQRAFGWFLSVCLPYIQAVLCTIC